MVLRRDRSALYMLIYCHHLLPLFLSCFAGCGGGGAGGSSGDGFRVRFSQRDHCGNRPRVQRDGGKDIASFEERWTLEVHEDEWKHCLLARQFYPL